MLGPHSFRPPARVRRRRRRRGRFKECQATIVSPSAGLVSPKANASADGDPGTLFGAASDRLAGEHRLVSIGEGGIVGLRLAAFADCTVNGSIQGLKGVGKA